MRSAPDRIEVVQVSHEAITCVPQIITYVRGSGERNEVQWKTKLSFGKTMLQVLDDTGSA